MRSGDRAAAATTAELVAGIATLAAELAARPAPESGAACYEQVDVLGRAVDVIESAIADRVDVATRTGVVAEWGHPSPAAWLRTTLGMRHTRAEERAALAAQLPRLPQVAKRLAAGDLSAGYAAAIAAGVRRLDDADCGKAEDLLLGFVDEGHSVGQITRFTDKIKDLIAERDDTSVAPEDARRAERQWLAVHRSGTGAFVKGHFGAELTALIKTKLEPMATPRGPEDTRDHAERLADALHTHLSNGDSRWDPILVIDLKQPVMPPQPATHQPATPQPIPHQPVPAQQAAPSTPAPARTRTPTQAKPDPAPATATADPAPAPAQTRPGLMAYAHTGQADERAAAPTRGQGESAAGSGIRTMPSVPQAPQALGSGWPFDGREFTARLADGTPIPTERARQILLNAGFSTLILGTDGHPLYLGRRVRCATPAQRRILLTRYATCVVDGCEIPATGCQVDHVNGWENGQPSDIDQLVMCCAFHNKYKWRHPDRITITQHNGRYHYHIARPGDQRRDRHRDCPTVGPSERGP